MKEGGERDYSESEGGDNRKQFHTGSNFSLFLTYRVPSSSLVPLKPWGALCSL